MNAPKNLYTAPLEEVLPLLSSSIETGLQDPVLQELRKAEGKNSTQSFHAFFPLLLILTYTLPALAVAFVLLRMGEVSVATVLSSGILLMAVGLYALVHHARQAEGARTRIKRKMDLIPVEVLRNGQKLSIPGKQLLPGDILLYKKQTQSIIPADCRLLPDHTVSIKHSWFSSWTNGTTLGKDEEVLLAGTEVAYIDATLLVVSIGDKRKLMGMYREHPAGRIVRAIWQAGLWYFLAVVLFLLLGLWLTILPRIAFALAIGTPVLLPYFFLRKGRGLRMQNTNSTPDHVLYPVEQLLINHPKEASILLKDTLLPLRDMKQADEEQLSTVGQFLELLDICVREEDGVRHTSLLQRLVTDARRLGIPIHSMKEWTYNASLSSAVFQQKTGTFQYLSSYVLRGNEEDNTLHLATDEATSLLDHCTYIWDSSEHTSRRRFYNGEKLKYATILQEHLEQGSLCYGLALRESEEPNAPWIYLGALIVPRSIEAATMEELHSYASNGHAVVLYSEAYLNPVFAEEQLKVPAKNYFEDAATLRFNNVRRHDMFLAAGVDALSLRELHQQLPGAVLVDTTKDMFVSSLYFWPCYIRFRPDMQTSFFTWLRRQVRLTQDGLTKGSQYAGLLAITTSLALFFCLLSPGLDASQTFLIGAILCSLLGLVAIIAHITDTSIRPQRLHQLAFLDVQQGLTIARVLLGGLVVSGLYTLLIGGALQREALPVELLFFLFSGMAAGTLSRLAKDTPSLHHTLFFAIFYALVTFLGYLFYFSANTLLPVDLKWLYCAGVILAGAMWIIGSYQSVPQSRT